MKNDAIKNGYSKPKVSAPPEQVKKSAGLKRKLLCAFKNT